MFGIFQMTDTESESDKQKNNPCFGGFSNRFRYEDSRGKAPRRKKIARVFLIVALCVVFGVIGTLSGVLIMNLIQNHQNVYYSSDDGTANENPVPNELTSHTEAEQIHSLSFPEFRTEDVTEEIAKRYRLPRGARITAVEADTNAYAAGFQSGDIIVALNGLGIEDCDAFSACYENCREGDLVTIRIFRDNGYEEISYTVPAD